MVTAFEDTLDTGAGGGGATAWLTGGGAEASSARVIRSYARSPTSIAETTRRARVMEGREYMRQVPGPLKAAGQLADEVEAA